MIFMVVLCLVFAATPALAEEPVLVDREVRSTSGVDIAREFVSSVTDIQLGSDGATVTLDVEGEEHSMNLDLGGEDGKGQVGGFFGLAALSGAALTAMKYLGKIGRLLH